MEKERCFINNWYIFDQLKNLAKQSNNRHILHFIFCCRFDDEQIILNCPFVNILIFWEDLC